MAGTLFLGWLLVEPRLAHAYTVSSVLTAGCHERITAEALRAVRLEMATAAAMPANRNERALITDLEFIPPGDMRDLGGATLLVGVRHNDLKGRDSNDLTELAIVHGDPSTQREHCLRDAQQDVDVGRDTLRGGALLQVDELVCTDRGDHSARRRELRKERA